MSNPRNPPRPHAPDWITDLESQFGEIEFLRNANVDPYDFVSNQMLAAAGFELSSLLVEDTYKGAMLNVARRKNYQPTLPPGCPGLCVGTSIETGRSIIVPVKQPCRVLVCGGSGSGKTNSIFILMLLLLRIIRVKVFVWEYKPEIRRIIPYWPDAILFTPRNAPWQFLHPIGNDPLAYFIAILSEIRAEFNLHPETVSLLWTITERMLRGRQPSDPPWCWEDWRRVCQHEAIQQKRENLFTAARAFLNICTVLGPQAAARIVPEIPEEYRLIAFDFVGQDPSILRLFLAFEFIRLLFKAEVEGHTEEFRQVFVFDEGSVLVSAELMNRAVAHISAAKRFVTMCRSTATGFIIGTQGLVQLDPFVLQNYDLLEVFRCTSVEDAARAAQMLALKPAAIEDLMRLPTGICYVRAAEWEQAVKIQVPLFKP